MTSTTRKLIAQGEGEDAARAGQPRTACPYPQSTAAHPDRHNLRFNWQLGYSRVVWDCEAQHDRH